MLNLKLMFDIKNILRLNWIIPTSRCSIMAWTVHFPNSEGREKRKINEYNFAKPANFANASLIQTPHNINTIHHHHCTLVQYSTPIYGINDHKNKWSKWCRRKHDEQQPDAPTKSL